MNEENGFKGGVGSRTVIVWRNVDSSKPSRFNELQNHLGVTYGMDVQVNSVNGVHRTVDLNFPLHRPAISTSMGRAEDHGSIDSMKDLSGVEHK